MDFAEIYHFLFETFPGIGVLVLICLVLSTIIAAVLERRTRKQFRDRGTAETDAEWMFDENK